MDGLLASLAGSAEEISDGRKQNIAAVVRTLFEMGLHDAARSFLVRTEETKPRRWSLNSFGTALRLNRQLSLVNFLRATCRLFVRLSLNLVAGRRSLAWFGGVGCVAQWVVSYG